MEGEELMEKLREWLANVKEKRAVNKEIKQLEKEQRTKWQALKHNTFAFFKFMCILGIVCIIALYIVVKPIINENRQTAFDKLSTINNNTFTNMENTEIYDKNDKLIASINVSNYKYVPIGDISDYLRKGYIAVEDKRFLEHNGIDLKSLFRAGFAMLKNKGEITQGGSTITQQVIKNTFLTQEQTFKRKIIEIFMAPELEKKYNKNDIIEFYMNSNFYGYNCYGVESACQYYFGKSAKTINAAEAATLIGTSNNPSRYNPVDNPNDSKEKRKQILGIMLADNVITQEEYDEACEYELELVLKRDKRTKEDYMTSYAIYCTAIKLMEMDGFEFQYTFKTPEEYKAYNEKYNTAYSAAASRVRSGGYKIYTSFDVDKQKIMQEIVDASLSDNTQKDKETGKYTFQGGAVVIDNSTGLVEVMVGGRGTDDEFNRGFLAVRQPGSTIKPVIDYGPAFDTGRYYPSLRVEDRAIEKGPTNWYSGYYGYMPIREALARSVNTIAYLTLQDISPQTGLEYLGKMKFTKLTNTDNVGAIALGGFTYGVRVVEMAKAYHTIWNNGKYIDNNCLRRVELQNVGEIYDGAAEKIEVYTPDTAYMLTSCMVDAVTKPYATATVGRLPNMVTACKTGTTNDSKDGWFCGYSPYYTGAVWVGYDTPKRKAGLGGSSYPGRIWKQYMERVHAELEPVYEFEVPETIIECNVDNRGNRTNNNTGMVDIFSSIADKTLAKKEEEHQANLMKAREDAEQVDESKRVANAEKLLNSYEKLECTEVKHLEIIDSTKQQCEVAIKAVSNYDKRDELTKRLEIQTAKFDEMRKPLDDAAELAKQQKMEDDAKKAKDTAEMKAKALGYTLKDLKGTINNMLGSLENVSNPSVNDMMTLGKVQGYVEVFKGTSDYPALYSRYSSVESTLKSRFNNKVVDTRLPDINVVVPE